MALNLTKHVVQADIYNFTFYPYSEGQKFYTTDTQIFYEDVGGYRCAVVPSKLIASTTALVTDTDLANNFAILNNAGTYSIYYYDSAGVPRLISGGGGGTGVHNDLSGIQGGQANTYFHSNQAINTTDTPSFSGIDISQQWRITKDVDHNFKIQENDSSIYTDRITIYETVKSGTPAAKIEIGKDENDVTLIHNLDFGGW